MQKIITVTPAKTQLSTSILHKPKRRTAGYARVSRDDEDQLNSYEAQVEYFTNKIQANPDWEFAGVYADEGISGTGTKQRKQFNQMVAAALRGEISLIVTKSVSRFARNTVDSLNTVRALKEAGCEVYFEKENIWTFDGKGELFITIMSSIAQEESRSISENVTWGKRRAAEAGKVSLPYKRFLGYTKGENGPVVVEHEAEIVRQIYAMFLQGKTVNVIARHLTNQNIPTPAGNAKWSVSTLKSILQNEKYAGNAVLQKTFCEDFLTKKMVKNDGQVPQVYVENSHPAIVSVEQYDLVQAEMNRRSRVPGSRQSGLSVFSSKLVCSSCGSFFGPKSWHSGTKYARTVWQCNAKHKLKCTTRHVYEDEIKSLFVQAFNDLIANRGSLLNLHRQHVAEFCDTSELDGEIARLEEELALADGLLKQAIDENARVAQDQEKYNKRYEQLSARCAIAQEQLDALYNEKRERELKKAQAEQFFKEIAGRGLVTEFDEQLWSCVVDSVLVLEAGGLQVRWRSGAE